MVSSFCFVLFCGLLIEKYNAQLRSQIKGEERMNWLPPHKCGLYLTHNEHLDVYESVDQFYDPRDFTSPDEWDKAISENNVWVLQWYPDTPVGFYRIAASTLEAIKDKLKEKNT